MQPLGRKQLTSLIVIARVLICARRTVVLLCGARSLRRSNVARNTDRANVAWARGRGRQRISHAHVDEVVAVTVQHARRLVVRSETPRDEAAVVWCDVVRDTLAELRREIVAVFAVALSWRSGRPRHVEEGLCTSIKCERVEHVLDALAVRAARVRRDCANAADAGRRSERALQFSASRTASIGFVPLPGRSSVR